MSDIPMRTEHRNTNPVANKLTWDDIFPRQQVKVGAKSSEDKVVPPLLGTAAIGAFAAYLYCVCNDPRTRNQAPEALSPIASSNSSGGFSPPRLESPRSYDLPNLPNSRFVPAPPNRPGSVTLPECIGNVPNLHLEVESNGPISPLNSPRHIGAEGALERIGLGSGTTHVIEEVVEHVHPVI